MFLLALLSAPAAALTLTPAGSAVEDMEKKTEEHVAARAIETRPMEEQVEEAETSAAMPVQLVSWDGDFELVKTSRRMRIWRSHIAYSLTVDAEGNATDCELTETFRMRRITLRLCDVLMAHHTFEPAQDENGTAVEGTYSSRISYQDMMERL